MKKMHHTGLHAEITLGLRSGYSGDAIAPEAVTHFLENRISEAVHTGGRVLPWRVATVTIVYPLGKKGQSEHALILSSDKNPRYNADLSDDEWKELVEKVAEALASEFSQVRVYISYTPCEVTILERRDAK